MKKHLLFGGERGIRSLRVLITWRPKCLCISVPACVPASLKTIINRFINACSPSGFESLCIKKEAPNYGYLFFWRRERDSNPRNAINVYTSSSRAPSTSSAISPRLLHYIKKVWKKQVQI